MNPYSNGYGQLSQSMTAEQVEERNAANRAAQFFNKSSSMGHMPYANQLQDAAAASLGHTELLDMQLREAQKARASGSQHFDTEAHRAFMRGLG